MRSRRFTTSCSWEGTWLITNKIMHRVPSRSNKWISQHSTVSLFHHTMLKTLNMVNDDKKQITLYLGPRNAPLCIVRSRRFTTSCCWEGTWLIMNKIMYRVPSRSNKWISQHSTVSVFHYTMLKTLNMVNND